MQRRHIAGALLGALVLMVPRLATAQAGATPGLRPSTPAQATDSAGAQPPDVCFRFMFGSWSPPLDWRAAGHRVPADSLPDPRSRARRGSAAEISTGADSALMLLPSWWPAGVLVELPTRTPALGDTLIGRATAFVADGSVAAPVSRVRAWRVDCRQATPS